MKFCSNCGIAVQGTPRFCSECGSAVGADTGTPVPEVASEQPEAAAVEEKGADKEPSMRWMLYCGAGLVLFALIAWSLAISTSGGGSSDTGTVSRSSGSGASRSSGSGVSSRTVVTAPASRQCLQWRTDYRTVPGQAYQTPYGQSMGPSTQVPTGQTCVRWG
jgi:hypothetical protein